MIKRQKTTHIILHTAAWPGDPGIEDIRRVHVDENGWSAVGYHYLIRKDGTLEKGRPEELAGAHCRNKNMNKKSIGICLSGHHDIEEPTEEQLSVLGFIVYRLRNHYDIPLYNVIGHREAGANKTCPGTKVDMDEIRNYLDAWEIIEITSADLSTEFEQLYRPHEN
jgi:N-acetylmuramoyl-L-alanine amidase